LAYPSATASIALAMTLAIPGVLPSSSTAGAARPVHSSLVPSIFDTWVRLPEAAEYTKPRPQQQVEQIRARTGWSQRRLAQVLRTTHPTIKAVEQGHTVVRVHDLPARLAEAHRLVQRIFLLAGNSAIEANRLLVTAPAPGQQSAVDLLKDRQPDAAYLAALAVLRPPRESPMMTGIWPSRAGTATTSLEDEGSS
jgi:transcriptional regulator with XRE-family HTH domain